ncbi:MAG TPA: zinc-dependent peptidase, partial [Candidatus Aminicenantes bacterium]|nr:zinc-dependent peptidase [Candidatus Aminicenantes bacterium]
MGPRKSFAASAFPPGKLVWATALLSLLVAIELGGGKSWLLLVLPLALWGAQCLLLPAFRSKLPPVGSRLPLGRIRLVQALDASGRARFERGFDHFRRTLKVAGTRGSPPGQSTRDWIAAGFATVFFTAGPPWPVFPRPIVVHPGRGFARDFSGRGENLAGLAMPTGPMVLAARAVAEGFADGGDGYNPVFHEIAHYLDFHATVEDAPPMSLSALMVDPAADGIPAGSSAQDSDRWSRVIGAELFRVTRGRSLFDPRLATDEGELFALAVERFFETP